MSTPDEVGMPDIESMLNSLIDSDDGCTLDYPLFEHKLQKTLCLANASSRDRDIDSVDIVGGGGEQKLQHTQQVFWGCIATLGIG